MSSRSATAYPEVEDDTSEQIQPLYHVILLNDEDHTYDYVIEMLQVLGGNMHVIAVCQPSVPVVAAVSVMEAARDPFVPLPDWRLPRSLGSMAAVVEPAAASA